MKKLLLILYILITFTLFSYDSSDDLIVSKISDVLIKEYDNYKDRTFMEKIILQFSKSAFIESVLEWKTNYSKLDTMKIILHPKIEYMVQKAEKNLDPDEGKYFRQLLEKLTLQGFKSLQSYYITVKEYLKVNKKSYLDINIELIDDATCNIKYYDEKKLDYEKEDKIKNEIAKMFKDDRLKYKLAFYAFAFNFLNKIRNDIEIKDMKKMLERIKAKESIQTSGN